MKQSAATARQSLANPIDKVKSLKGSGATSKFCKQCHKKLIDTNESYLITEDDPEALLLSNLTKNKMLTSIRKLFSTEVDHYK